ncbi:hypothetical protein CHGG_00609 [Chaetomium globosum CBS 148.51]|uniref:tRNA/rRNA methyltransferase SpoU type domain-containing protein n=1 Tax=Chaetomium globosum (strain ATCC 6205 / CBS 148.51 / DSM 1962 / NBRC 6347 / NRRL 1970) TaxID=306901 RepID=Q2HGP5_CHAGB|nr:uncharacterized protein CHGG_00609 [Chaetomium globosum CBS 148.51]EAQ92374.1 hypothetical protein CHGG_00609 [Chaetomium globosum CBS 148.51]
MSLSLVYRAARSSLLANSIPRISLTAFPARHASLSAINRGLVRSEKARPQGARSDKFNDLAEGGKRLNYAERKKARQELAKQRPNFKIRKGKKDITMYPEKAKAQSRQARFYDPKSSFGKKSLVYKMKTGQLSEELKALQPEDSGSTNSAFERTGLRPDLQAPRRTARKSARRRDGKGDRDMVDAADFIAALSQPAHSSSDGGRRDAPSRSRDGAGSTSAAGKHRDAPPRGRDSFGGKDASQTRDSFGSGNASRDSSFKTRDSSSKAHDTSFNVHDTSARPRPSPRQERDGSRDFSRRDRDTDRRFRDAPRPERDSFAPRDSPRRDREYDRDFEGAPHPEQDTSSLRTDQALFSITYTTAASQFLYGKSVRKNIPTTILGEDGMRLLDKMASSRPHNGFVLEASPLPQPPLTALAPVPEDYASNPRCAITLGHQSAEEAAINGHPTSIPTLSPTHKPLVLILDQILDPGNLGAILRTASFLGATAVGITRHGSAPLTPVALKASSGAAESLSLFSVSSLPEFLNASRANGWAVYAAVAEGPSSERRQRRHVDVRDVTETDPLKREPCVLLVGNEGEGLSRLVVKKADYEVNVPNLAMPGSGVDSLNVSVAVGLLCSAFLSGVSREMGGFGALKGLGGGGEGVKENLW